MEKSLKGGKDSFTETLRTDTALVRKRIANPALKIKSTLHRPQEFNTGGDTLR